MGEFDFYVFNDSDSVLYDLAGFVTSVRSILGVSLPGLAAERWWAEQESSAKSFKPAPVVHLCQSLLSFQNSILSSDSPLPLSQPNLGCRGSPQGRPGEGKAACPALPSRPRRPLTCERALSLPPDLLANADWETGGALMVPRIHALSCA